MDINPNSCEISKLRLWIELLKYSYYIFDENGKPTNALETLPNIDINIKCGNSLISNFPLDSNLTIGQTKSFSKNLKIQIQNYKDSVMLYKEGLGEKARILQDIANVKSTIISYLIEKNPAKLELKDSLQAFIRDYDKEFFDPNTNFGIEMLKIARDNNYKFTATLTSLEPAPLDKTAYKLLEKIQKSYETLENLKSPDAFEWRFEFPEVLDDEGNFLGFDVVIGNPPYIKEGGNKELFASTKHLRTYQGKMDIWYHFVGRGLEILKQNGELSFIATNNWITNAGAGKLRNILLAETQFISLVDFGDYKVFESADIQTMIMRFKKTPFLNHYSFDYRKISAKKPNDANRIALLQKTKYEGNLYFEGEVYDQKICLSQNKQIFVSILDNELEYLEDNEISQGITPNPDFVNSKNIVLLNNQNIKVGEGVFGYPL